MLPRLEISLICIFVDRKDVGDSDGRSIAEGDGWFKLFDLG